MFDGATSFNGDLSQWNVSSVTEMDSMFYGTTSFNGDLSQWDVSSGYQYAIPCSIVPHPSTATSRSGTWVRVDHHACHVLWRHILQPGFESLGGSFIWPFGIHELYVRWDPPGNKQ